MLCLTPAGRHMLEQEFHFLSAHTILVKSLPATVVSIGAAPHTRYGIKPTWRPSQWR